MSLKYEVTRTSLRLRYFRHGHYHRLDGPSILWIYGEIYWHHYGEPL